MRRVFVEALVAALFVGIGSFLLYDSVEDWSPVSEEGSDVLPSLKQSLSWALRKFNIMVTDAPMPCGDVNTTSLSLNGSCAFLDGKAGCCSQPPMIPTVPVGSDSTCSSACVPAWTGYWCQLSCVAFNVNKTKMCRSAAQSMFSSCSSCSSLSQYFKSATTVDQWATAFGYQLVDYQPCIDFTQGTPSVESSAPVLVLAVPTSIVTITSNTQITLTVTATTASAPSSSVLRLKLGAQNLLSVRAGASKWSKQSANTWLFSMTIQLSNLAPSGAYAFSAVVRNGAGETTAESTFNVRTVVTATSIATWELCTAGTGVDGSVVPTTVTAIDTLNCCGATCDLSAAAGRSVSLKTFSLRGTAVLRSFVMSISGMFKLESTATSLTLLSTMTMRFLAGSSMIVQQNLLLTTDSTSMMWFRRSSTFAVRGSRRMLNCAGRSFSETNVQVDIGARLQISGANGNFVTNSSLAVAGDVEANTTSTTSDAIELKDGTAVTGSGRFKIGRGRAIFRKVTITIKMVLAPFIKLVSAGAKVNLATLQAQAPMCGTAAAQISVEAQTAAIVQLEKACEATAGIPTVANSASLVQVLSGGAVKFTGVSNSSGVMKATSVDFQTGSIVEIEFVSGFESTLTSAETDIAVMKYGSSTLDNATCSTNAQKAEVTVAGGTLVRSTSVFCNGTSGDYTLWVKFANTSAVPAPVAPPTVDQFAFNSTKLYTLVLNKDCASFPNSSFVDTIAITRKISPLTIIVTEYKCGSITAMFKCRGVSAAAADNTCTSITNEANTPGSALNNALGVQGSTRGVPSASKSDESNQGLYALFALLLIPICCCIGFFLYKRKGKAADQQFAADTLTFSSVALPPKGSEMMPGAYDPYSAAYSPTAGAVAYDGYSQSYADSAAFTGTTGYAETGYTQPQPLY